MTAMRPTRYLPAPSRGQFAIYCPERPELTAWVFTFAHTRPAAALNQFLASHAGLAVLDCSIAYGR